MSELDPVEVRFKVNDKDIAEASRRAVDSIVGIGKAGEDAVRSLRKQIKEQKEIIAHVSKDVKDITGKFEKMVPGGQKEAYAAEVRAVKRALEEEKAVLKGLETQLDTAHDAARRLTHAKRDLTDRMMKLKLAGHEDTEAFRKLAAEASEVDRAIRSVNKQMSNIGRVDSGFQGLVSGLSGVAGALSAGAGTMALFGNESKNLQQVQTRLQALMAITIGLQQTYNSLNSSSAFHVTVLAKAKKAWAVAQDFLNVKLGIGIGLSRALMVTGVGALIAGIGLLVAAYQRWAKEQEEINALQESFKNIEIEVAKSMVEQTVKVRGLIAVTENHNISLSNRRKAILQLKEIMPGYNAYIDEEGVLVGNATEQLAQYLEVLYKVEKAKKKMSKLVELSEQREELELRGSEKFSFWDSMEVGFLNIFNPDAGERLLNEKLHDKTTRWIRKIDDIKKQEEAIQKDLYKSFEDDSVFNAILGGKAGTEKKQAAKAGKEKKSQEQKINEELRRLAEKNITDRLELMDEGTRKEIAKIRDKKNLANDLRIKEEKQVISTLVDKYKGFAAQRLAIEEKYNKDITDLRERGLMAAVQSQIAESARFAEAASEAEMKKAKELTAFDFDVLKKNPDYVRAFEDLRNTSTETLSYLLEQFQLFKEQASESLDPAQLREYTNTIQQVLDELTARNPFKALAASQDALRQSKMELSVATANLNAARGGGDTERATAAEQEYRRALDKVYEATNNVLKSQKAVNDVMHKFFETVTRLGDLLGGQAGQIIGLIAEIGNFVITSVEGIKTAEQAGVKALATLEKASAILGVIQLVVQLISVLDSLVSDAHKEYERFAEKQKQINLLSTAVNDYQLAVLKAKNAEDAWFSEDKIRDLWQLREQGARAYQSYVKKSNEEQIRYVNKYSNKFKNISEALHRYHQKHPDGKRPTKADIEKETVSALENLRIETRAGYSRFFGIIKKSQKTEDLRDFVRKNLNVELFGKDNRLNTAAYEQIMEKYGNKLVGETKETLEYLKKMQEEYDVYKEQLQEYVSSRYSPLLDNMTSALWDWFDSGRDVMDSFKEYSRDTFRSIATDMLKSIVNKHIFKDIDKKLKSLYDGFFQGKISEKQLYAGIAEASKDLDKSLTEKLPIVKESMKGISETLKKAGTDIRLPKQQQAERGFHTSVSQESFNEWLGQFVALRIHASNIYSTLADAEKSTKTITGHLFAIESNTHETVRELRETNNRLKRLEIEGIKLK